MPDLPMPVRRTLPGMGKSGIIAQKIASTMVSTGTPAMFLHPAEGAHGDIGIAHKDDVILAISKSGESDELIGLLPTIRRIGARLITITTDADSAIARQSDVVLLTPVEEEACPLNMAPTCSTTAALVVGDALAMALMKLRNFQPEEFALYHPGGQIGKRSEEHTAELQSLRHLVCRLLLEKKKQNLTDVSSTTLQ